MVAISRIRTLSVTYKFKLRKFRLFNLHYNHQESYPKNLRHNYRGKSISCCQKENNITHFPWFELWWISHISKILLYLWIFVNFLQSWLGFMSFVNLLCHKFLLRKFILPFLSLVMKTNSSTWLKLCTPISSLKLT